MADLDHPYGILHMPGLFDLVCVSHPFGWRVIDDDEARAIFVYYGEYWDLARPLPSRNLSSSCIAPLGHPVTIVHRMPEVVSVLRSIYHRVLPEFIRTIMPWQVRPEFSSSSSASSSSSSVVVISEMEFAASVDMPPRRKTGEIPLVNLCTEEDVQRWMARYQIDRTEFRVTIPGQGETLDSLRTKPNQVPFFLSQFEVGMRIPLDPFLCEFLDFTNSTPLDLPYNTVVMLISFIIVCRSVCIEPSLTLLSKFFVFSCTKNPIRLIGRANASEVRLIATTENKVRDWDKRVILVESRSGWQFPKPVGSIKKLSRSDLEDDVDEAVERLRELVGYEVEKDENGRNTFGQSHWIPWEGLVADEPRLVMCGVSRARVRNATSRILFSTEPVYLEWGVHGDRPQEGFPRIFYFADQCPYCTSGSSCYLQDPNVGKYSVVALRKKRTNTRLANEVSEKTLPELPLPTEPFPVPDEEEEKKDSGVEVLVDTAEGSNKRPAEEEAPVNVPLKRLKKKYAPTTSDRSPVEPSWEKEGWSAPTQWPHNQQPQSSQYQYDSNQLRHYRLNSLQSLCSD